MENKIKLENHKSETPLIWLETPKNPTSTLQDIRYYCRLAQKIGGIVVVDSTFATPIIQQPLELGADFVIHSSSKFMAGHSDLTAGVIVTKNEQTAAHLREQRNVMGCVLGNFETWLLLRSLRTLSLRVHQQTRSATLLAEWLEKQVQKGNRRITRVWYPGLPSSKYYGLCQTQMNGLGGGILSIEMQTIEDSLKLKKRLKIFRDATSLGGYESLVDYRYIWDKTVPPTLLRISIGLENPSDLIKDFDTALTLLSSDEPIPSHTKSSL